MHSSRLLLAAAVICAFAVPARGQINPRQAPPSDVQAQANQLLDRERLERDSNAAMVRRDFPALAEAAERLLERTEAESGSDSLQSAQARARYGSALYLNNQPVGAVRSLRRAVSTLESELGIYHPDLVEPLGYLGLSLQQLQRHESAADALVRARHITHRQLGLLNEQQIPLVYSAADSVAAQGELWQAEQLQYAVYRLHEHNFGATSPETVGALNRLALWLTDVQRFQPALSLYRLGLRSLEDAEGNDTPEMVPLMEGMARTFLFQRIYPGRALNLLLRVVELTDERRDHFKAPDRFLARVQLGDALLLFSHERDAMEHYLAAWNVAHGEDGMGDWAHKLFDQRTLVAGPFMEISEPENPSQNWFRFQFDLRADGRPQMVDLVETNARAGLASYSINLFRSVRFRPLIVQGEARPRAGQEILLAFRRGS